MAKQFGGKISAEHLKKYAESSNWDGKKFVNLEETKMEFKLRNVPSLMKKQIFDRKNKEPKSKIPVIPINKEEFCAASVSAKIIWYGHSAILMRINQKTILIDPMLGPDASPIAPFKTNRFSENTLDLIGEFPEIDLVLLSHDHYDHLDLESIKRLLPKTKQFFVALGVGRHLAEWGVDKNIITEFDWWQNIDFEDIKITFTPSRHFAGRGLTDRAKSFWGGWVFKTNTENIYFSGDGGYGNHFVEIGEKLGPFDFAFVECGQYNENWHQIHMYPEEAVQAGIDAQAKKMMPIHWAGFSLAVHHWKDPIERFFNEAQLKKANLVLPKIGEMFDYKGNVKINKWWEEIE